MSSREEKLEAFGRFIDVLDRLRIECPWDRKQSNESLRTNTIEEVYELSDALLSGDSDKVCKELGDVLLHVAFYAKIAEEKEEFDITTVCDTLVEKLVFRHPHIFGTVNAADADAVAQNWEQLKLKEKEGNKTVFEGVPDSLPSLIKAYRIQDKARGVGFDWAERSQVWDKVREEFEELQVEIEQADQKKSEEELGDLLFSLINAARLYKLNPDDALESTCRKFIRRFNYVEQQTLAKGLSLNNVSLSEMDRLWNEAKTLEKK